MTLSIRVVVLAGFALFVGACSTVPAAENIQVEDYTPETTHRETVGLAVHGGWTFLAQVSKEAFAEAVVSSLLASRIFSALVDVEDADYRLDVVIDDTHRPPAGARMTNKLSVLWTVSRVQPHEILWQKLITSSYTAPATDAFVGVVRSRMAAEGAARNNIREALSLLESLSLRSD